MLNPHALLELKKRVEEKAFVYGNSRAVSYLLSEYVYELLTQSPYVRHTTKNDVA